MLPNISIIIPVKNGITTIHQCLDAIFNQTLINQTEVIIIDSGSTDGTLELIKEYPVRLYQIPPKEFNHGATRNYGVSFAKGKLVVMTVQDAIATDTYWLEKMSSHFTDLEIIGVCGQQYVPHDKDMNPYEWHRPISKPKPYFIQFKKFEDFKKLSPKRQREICGWDDVNAMYRKSALLNHPLPNVKFGEDLIWSSQVIALGFKLIYDPSAKMKHYHNVSFKEEFKRNRIEMLQDYISFNLIPSKKSLLKVAILNSYRMIKWRIPIKWFIYQLKKDFAFNQAVQECIRIINHSSKNQIKLHYF